MNSTQIRDLDALKTGLAGAQFLLFKHSTRCGTSARAFGQYSSFLADHGDTPSGWIDVVAQPELSREVEQITGVAHESPQALWIRNGTVAWHASHWKITADALGEAVQS